MIEFTTNIKNNYTDATVKNNKIFTSTYSVRGARIEVKETRIEPKKFTSRLLRSK